jgi:hypothetical protein
MTHSMTYLSERESSRTRRIFTGKKYLLVYLICWGAETNTNLELIGG